MAKRNFIQRKEICERDVASRKLFGACIVGFHGISNTTIPHSCRNGLQLEGGGLEALDIGTPIGTPVYATVSGTVKSVDSSRGSLDQRIAVTPNCPGLSVVYYWHLSEVNVVKDQKVLFAQQIGLSGLEGTGPHTHYQFNPQNDRGYSISDPPHVPVSVPRYCDPDPCGITITSAP